MRLMRILARTIGADRSQADLQAAARNKDDQAAAEVRDATVHAGLVRFIRPSPGHRARPKGQWRSFGSAAKNCQKLQRTK